MSEMALIALGANLPLGRQEPAQTVRLAMTRAGQVLGRLEAVSPIYRSPAFPAGSGPDYANAVIRVQTEMEAGAILSVLHQLEAGQGRQRQARWAGRTLDLDLLALGPQVLPDAATQGRWRDLDPAMQAELAPDRLILPHPRLQDRAFVLVPLADVAPFWRHPVLGLDAAQMLAALPAGAGAELAVWGAPEQP